MHQSAARYSEPPAQQSNDVEQPDARKPWLAALLSLLLPGFGQLYNGQLNRAILVFMAFCFLTVPAIAMVALYLPAVFTVPALVIGLLLTLALWVYAVMDAARAAKRLVRYHNRPWQTFGMYLLVFCVCVLLVLPGLIHLVRKHQVHAFRIPSASMSPTVLPGDYLFVDKRYNCPGCRTAVERGDVAVFVYPNDRTRYYIKRILALPGDWIESDETDIRVVQDAADPQSNGMRQVPPGHVFVIGDNRERSTDSRDFGEVPLADVVGVARQVWFSRGPDGIRWSRVGTTLQ